MLSSATTTPMAVGAEPIEPAEAVFALLLAGRGRPSTATAGANACARSASRRTPSGGAGACRPRTCRAAARSHNGGWCNARASRARGCVRPRSVSSTMVSLDQPPAASIAARRIRHIVPCTMMALNSLRCTMPISKKPAYSAFMAAMHQRAVAVAMILRRLHQADLRIGEQRHQIFQPIRHRRHNRHR